MSAELASWAGVSTRHLSVVGHITVGQVERIEQGVCRTRRSTPDRFVAVMLLASPDLGQRDDLVDGLCAAAGAALAPESPYAAKSLSRRDGKPQRLADRRAMYRHLRR